MSADVSSSAYHSAGTSGARSIERGGVDSAPLSCSLRAFSNALHYLRRFAYHPSYKYILSVVILSFLVGEFVQFDTSGAFTGCFFLLSLFVILPCEFAARFHFGLIRLLVTHFEFYYMLLLVVANLFAFIWTYHGLQSDLETSARGGIFFLANFVVISLDAAPLIPLPVKFLLPTALAVYISGLFGREFLAWDQPDIIRENVFCLEGVAGQTGPGFGSYTHARTWDIDSKDLHDQLYGQCIEARSILFQTYLPLLVFHIKYLCRFAYWIYTKAQPRCIILKKDISFQLCEMPIGGDPFERLLERAATSNALEWKAGQVVLEDVFRKTSAEHREPLIDHSSHSNTEIQHNSSEHSPQLPPPKKLDQEARDLKSAADSPSNTSQSSEPEVKIVPEATIDEEMQKRDTVTGNSRRTTQVRFFPRPSIWFRDESRVNILHIVLEVIPSRHTIIAMKRYRNRSYHPFVLILSERFLPLEKLARSKIYLAGLAILQLLLVAYEELPSSIEVSDGLQYAILVVVFLAYAFLFLCELTRIDHILFTALLRSFDFYYLLSNLAVYCISAMWGNLLYETGLKHTWQLNAIVFVDSFLIFLWVVSLDAMPSLSFRFKRLMIGGLFLNCIRRFLTSLLASSKFGVSTCAVDKNLCLNSHRLALSTLASLALYIARYFIKSLRHPDHLGLLSCEVHAQIPPRIKLSKRNMASAPNSPNRRPAASPNADMMAEFEAALAKSNEKPAHRPSVNMFGVPQPNEDFLSFNVQLPPPAISTDSASSTVVIPVHQSQPSSVNNTEPTDNSVNANATINNVVNIDDEISGVEASEGGPSSSTPPIAPSSIDLQLPNNRSLISIITPRVSRSESLIISPTGILEPAPHEADVILPRRVDTTPTSRASTDRTIVPRRYHFFDAEVVPKTANGSLRPASPGTFRIRFETKESCGATKTPKRLVLPDRPPLTVNGSMHSKGID